VCTGWAVSRYLGYLRSSEVDDLAELFGVEHGLDPLLQHDDDNKNVQRRLSDHRCIGKHVKNVYFVMSLYQHIYDLYLSFDAKSSVLHDQRVLGELVEQILPLARQLTKRTLGDKENASEREHRGCGLYTADRGYYTR